MSDIMDMSIPEQFLLLTVAADGKGFIPQPADVTGAAFFSSAIMELAQQGRIDRDLDRIWITDATPIGDDSVDLVLNELSGREFQTGRFLTQTSSIDTINEFVAIGREVRERVLQRLCGRKVLSPMHGSWPWHAFRKRYEVSDKNALDRVRASFIGSVVDDDVPCPRELCLMCLVETTGLLRHLAPPEKWDAARKKMSQYVRVEFGNMTVFDQIEMLEWSLTEMNGSGKTR